MDSQYLKGLSAIYLYNMEFRLCSLFLDAPIFMLIAL
jgi:hypothetical protein